MLFSGKVQKLAPLRKIYVGHAEESVQCLTPEKERKSKSSILVKFFEIHSIEAAERLRDQYLFAPSDELTPLAEDEFYIEDLIGLNVVHAKDGGIIGRVIDILQTGGTDILQIRRGEKIILIPLAKPMFKEIDLKKKRLVADPPEGLLELNEI